MCRWRSPRRAIRRGSTRARAGRIRNFTGIDAPYEPPEAPELVLPTAASAPEELADRVLALLGQG